MPFFPPVGYSKPPFHTYLNFFLIRVPWRLLADFIDLPIYQFEFVRLILCRLLTLSMFLGMVTLIYLMIKKYFNAFTANVLAILFAVSPGFILHTHYLSADIPVTFWMMLSFHFSLQIMNNKQQKFSPYLWASIFVGIATATKYNGVAIAIAIVIAHVLNRYRHHQKLWAWAYLFNKNLWMSGLMIIISFIVVCPNSVLESKKFWGDFYYNYQITPVYSGIASGNSYFEFLFKAPPHLYGWLVFILILLSNLALILAMVGKKIKIEKARIYFFILLWGSFWFYTAKMGNFPRYEHRFALPIYFLPFMSSAFIIHHARDWIIKHQSRILKIMLSIGLIIIILSNAISSARISYYFTIEPRMLLYKWLSKNIPKDSSVYYSPYAIFPKKKMVQDDIVSTKMQGLDGKARKQIKAFPEGSPMAKSLLARIESDDKKIAKWYSKEALDRVNPDYIIINSQYYKRFFEPDRGYPKAKEFFQFLLEEKYSYKIIKKFPIDKKKRDERFGFMISGELTVLQKSTDEKN